MSVESSQSFNAGGDIAPCTFVKRDSTADDQVLQAGATDQPCGIAADWTRYAPWTALDDGKNAVSGENVKVFLPGSKRVKILLGGSVSPGNLLKPTTGGKAIAVTTDGDYYGAVANQAGVSGEVIDCDVLQGQQAS